jgi:alpha-mannosidase
MEQIMPYKKSSGPGVAVMALILMANLSGTLHASSRQLWKVGNFDETSVEFKKTIDFSESAQEISFTVGKSNPATDWCAYQPGSGNVRAGRRPHPFTINFDVPGTPSGVYSLKTGLLVDTAFLPDLQVEINGHRGLFHLHPRLLYGAGNASPVNSYAIIIARLPFRFIHKGANKLVLTAIDDPVDRIDPLAGDWGNSSFSYDALELDNDSAEKNPAQDLSAEVVPTIFYRSKAGKVLEVLDLFITGIGLLSKAEVTLSLGAEKYVQKVQSENEFGEHHLEFEVPEFQAPVKGEVVIISGAHSTRFPVSISPGKRWNIFVVPNQHLDVGYTDYQAKVAEIQSRAIDETIEMIRRQPDFRYSPDAYWCVEQFLRGRSQEQRQALLEMIAQKKIFIPAQYGSNLTGFASLEDTIRSLYPSYQFYLKNGGAFDYANITDVPSYSWSYASVLAASGLKYFVASGNNDGRSSNPLITRLNESSPFWWVGPDGGRILVWYSLHYMQVNWLFGLPPNIKAGRDSLPRFLQAYSRPEYKSDGAIIYGSQTENTDLFPQQAALVGEWNENYAFPKLRFSGFAEAMRHIETQSGDSIPVLRGDGGPYWEDGMLSNTAITALARSNEQRVLAAEKFSTISSLVNPRIRPDSEVMKLMWDHLRTFDEHTWTADRSWLDPGHTETVRQSAFKNVQATDGKLFLEHLLDRAMASIADYIPRPSGTLVAFNPLNWARSSLVEADIDRGIELVDLATGESAPYQELSAGRGYRHIRFLATNVPPLGYKCYALQPIKSGSGAAAENDSTTLESPFYRVILDPATGSVRSLVDKELNRELVDSSSPYRFNQFIYVTGGDQPSLLTHYRPNLPTASLESHGAGGGHLISVVKTSFGSVAKMESSALNTPRIETEVLLYDGQKRIEFINHVKKNEVYTREAVYFAFPFAMDHPEFRYEIQNGFVNPARDILKSGNFEWFSVQHWVAVDQDGISAVVVPVDGHLVTLGDIVRGTWPKEFGSRKGTVFSYLMNNYWETNWPAGQGGDYTFRYAVTSGRKLNPGVLSRFGWEAMSPIELNEIKAQDKAVISPRPLDPSQSSFLRVDPPNVIVVTWKLAEDGQGTILRLVETNGTSGMVKIETPILNFRNAWICNAMERNERPVSVSGQSLEIPVKPFEIVTLRLEGRPAIELPK